MGTPVTATDFTVNAFSGDLCERLGKLLEIHEKLKEFFSWAFNSDGTATSEFLALFASISVPTGSVIFYPRESYPAGYLEANGQAVSRVLYPGLFQLYGTQFGNGNGTDTFNLPDLKGRFLLGRSGTYPVGTPGGEAAHTLLVSELPKHTHPIALKKDATGGAGYDWATWEQSTSSSSDRSTNTGETGGDTAHNNMPPFFPGLWLVKT